MRRASGDALRLMRRSWSSHANGVFLDSRIRWLAAALALSFASAACKDRPASGQDPERATARGQLVWLRNAEVLDAPSGKPLRHVVEPILVELLAGGRVRGAATDGGRPGSSASPQLDGFLASRVLETPVEGEGLSLYARTVGDLHLDAPGGPIIGRLHPGAFVSVAPASGSWAVALPGFRNVSASIVAYIDGDKLGPEPVRAITPPAEGRLIKDFPPGVDLFAAPQDRRRPFANPICGPARVTGEGADVVRISQFYGGVELIGWVDGSVAFQRGPIRCSLRTVSRDNGRLRLFGGPTAIERADVPAPPEGFVSRDSGASDELSLLLTKGASIHWLVPTQDGARCDEWKFERARTPRNGPADLLEGRLTRIEPAWVDGERGYPSFAYGYRSAAPNREISLGGPHWLDRADGARAARVLGGSTCMTRYAFVGSAGGALRMFPGGGLSEDVVAWHPDDEEHWFLTRSACLAAVDRATQAIQREPEGQPPGGIHIDCLDELLNLREKVKRVIIDSPVLKISP